MSFHLGKPVLVMFVISALSGVAILLRPAPPPKDLTVWVFADPHARTYRALAPRFEAAAGRSVDVRLIGNQALDVRLTGLFLAGTRGAELPDLAEVEINSVGRYFRPPAELVGFLPLNDFLHHTGWREIRTVADTGRAGWAARLVPDDRIYVHDGARWLPDDRRRHPYAWADYLPESGWREIRAAADPGQR